MAGGIAALGSAAIALVAIAAGVSGCSHVYFPGTSPIPLMSARGEVQATGFITSDGMGIRAAVSPLRNVLVCATAEKQNAESETPRSHSWETGAGWYAPPNPLFRFEAFVGFGGGYGRDTLIDINLFGPPSPPTSMEASYRKYFAQMNFGLAGIVGPAFLKDAMMEGGWGARLSYLNFYNYRAGDATSHEHATSLHFCCMVRYGPPYAQIIAQLDAEQIITSSTYIRTRGVSSSVGIQLAYGRIAAEP